jgi:histone-lysine N-methyltransferase SETMAR
MYRKKWAQYDLRMIGHEYHKERRRTIGDIFRLQHERKTSPCAPFTFLSSTARKWLSLTCRFVNVLSFNFLCNKETRQQSSTSDFVVCMEMSAWVSAVSEGGWNILKDGNTDIADQPRCFRPRTAATERNKQKVDKLIRHDWTITVREIAGPPRGPKKKTVILQHDNARPHTARLTLQTIQKNGWELLSHPPYHPTVQIWPPSDYHLFGPLKDHLRRHHYVTDEAVHEAVRSWLRGDGTDFYLKGNFKILQRWQKYVDLDGDFVVK